MNNKLTNEEIAKVFAMYLYCEVLGEWDDEPRKAYLTGIHGEYEAELQYFELDGVNVFEEPEYRKFQDCKLLLTPLSDITDEDAIEVAVLMEYEGNRQDKIKLLINNGRNACL